MMEKKALRIILIGFLLIIITGCSESTPTGEMVYKNPGTGTFCQEHALCSTNLFLDS
ncbi:MAG: hypothetical protein K2H31_05325 [Lachnospiraceae bacterium]|nr:hypothetical protein [Lachnospiraceae bacterium]